MSRKISLNDLPDLITRPELAELLYVSPLTLRKWAKLGTLVPLKINNKHLRYTKKQVLDYLEIKHEEV